MLFPSKHKSAVPDEFTSLAKLITYLEISEKEFNYLTKHSKWLYNTWVTKKRTGGYRVINSPNDRLKFLQRRILLKLEEIYIPRRSVHGFVKKRGVLSNAAVHQKRPFLLNIDLKDFFGTITYNRVLGVLKSMKVNPEVAAALTSITVNNNMLPQGAPTSPILANMVSFKLDIAMHKYAKKHYMRYTRFADDITFSSFIQPLGIFANDKVATGKLSEENLAPELLKIITLNGFTLNQNKLWFSDRKLRKEVTGLTVNQFPNVPRKFVRNLRASLYKIETLGYTEAENDYHKRYCATKNLRKVIRGRIDWVGQVKGLSDPVFRKLAAKYNQLFPDSVITVEPTYEEIVHQAIWIVEWCEDVDGEPKGEQGTAFFLDGIGLVTAHHVLENLPDGKQAEIYLPSNLSEKYQVTLGPKHCKHTDVTTLLHNIPSEKFLSLPSSSGGYRKRDQVIAYGFPSYNVGDELHEVDGAITAVSMISAVERITVSAIFNKGISGGPLLDNRYHVIGMVHKGGTEEVRQLATSIASITKALA